MNDDFVILTALMLTSFGLAVAVNPWFALAIPACAWYVKVTDGKY